MNKEKETPFNIAERNASRGQ